ncbi:MAG: DUF802 domain-containing protein [Azonexus sp.]|jgi:hypothetical protein|nr:DUF802 domain-containing protein [Azonexus sp.]
MNRNHTLSAFVLGLLAAVWVAFTYIGGSMLALAVTLIITAVYLVGALEMRRFHRNTIRLAQALNTIPNDLAHLGEWLQQVPAALQNTVRLRIEGERVALPGPGLTPYLVGLLVLLGMLGTFLGMVVTLNGAVLALENTTDLQTIRSALAAPVKGLGVAFGTSVAGVATSAMLGLMSALCRRDRIKVGQLLDNRIAGVLRDFSLTYQRQETFKALQSQAQTLPELVGKLDAMMRQMTEQNRQLGEHLLAGQERFHSEAKTLYSDLAQSIDLSLKASLKDSATVAVEAIQPVVAATMTGIANETRDLHDKLFGTVQDQLEGIASQFTQAVDNVSDTWMQALTQHEQATDRQHQQLQSGLASYADSFERSTTVLLTSVNTAHSSLLAESAKQRADLDAELALRQAAMAQAAQAQQMAFTQQLTTLLGDLQATQAELQRDWTSAAIAQQQEITQTLGNTARDFVTTTQRQAETTITEVTRLMQVAAEAPKAAADVIGQLHHALSASMARDNSLLEERAHIMKTLSALLDVINHASTEQRSAVDALVASSTLLLERAGSQFANKVEREAGKLIEIGAGIAGGALEVASLGEAFSTAVKLFAESSDKMMGTLQRIESALAKSLTRSDEQLAYYVAQAREIIDLSILSQKKMVDDLQRVAVNQSVA